MSEKKPLKTILIIVISAVVVAIAAFFFFGHPPSQNQTNANQVSQTQFTVINMDQSATFNQFYIELTNITTIDGQTYAVLYMVDNSTGAEGGFYIGANQYVTLGNGGAPYILVSQISDSSATVNVLQSLPSGFTQALKNGHAGNFVTPSSIPSEFLATTWTTDKPANYSNIVTIAFFDSSRGVKYELINGKGYMAESFTYKITDNTIEMTNSDNSVQSIPFTLSGDILNLNYNGQNISFNRDWQNMTYLTNKY